VCCSVLPCVAACCSVLQRAAACCSILHGYRQVEVAPPGLDDECGTVAAGYVCERATVELVPTRFRRPGDYWVSQLNMEDVSLNSVSQYFTDGQEDEPRMTVTQTLYFADPDPTPPVLDHDSIQILASPTNPEAPNGETKVTIVYKTKDDKSGLGIVSYRLMDPQGGFHFEYHYHPNFYTLFFDGDATVWSEYIIEVVLPVGSPPGTWGLQSMDVNARFLPREKFSLCLRLLNTNINSVHILFTYL